MMRECLDFARHDKSLFWNHTQDQIAQPIRMRHAFDNRASLTSGTAAVGDEAFVKFWRRNHKIENRALLYAARDFLVKQATTLVRHYARLAP